MNSRTKRKAKPDPMKELLDHARQLERELARAQQSGPEEPPHYIAGRQREADAQFIRGLVERHDVGLDRPATEEESCALAYAADMVSKNTLVAAVSEAGKERSQLDQANAVVGARVRMLVNGGSFDLRDSPKSFISTCERLVREADEAFPDATEGTDK